MDGKTDECDGGKRVLKFEKANEPHRRDGETMGLPILYYRHLYPPFTRLLTMPPELHSVPVTTLIFDVDDTLYDVS